ncbi:hypothetical protein B0A49_08930 [Cryomyces minteri]|uniref:STEEP1 domain-containing protein n=1 Tax=Cryomyces minteri TaxID=331657 RepID=A0A4U0W2Y5_9PEZI|nr:hypothetical protein B0A49_08930 [Cryomyces minteri]
MDSDSRPQPSPSPPSSSSLSSPTAHLHTYHCICTSLILASTTPLTALSVRASPSLDKASILPLPPPPRSSSPSDSDDEDPSFSSQKRPRSTHYVLLLSTLLDRKPIIVRRTDGFEKRWLQRCGRCRVVIGYQLDASQYADAGEDEQEEARRDGKREDMVYLLPGGLVSTEDMRAGRGMEGVEALGQR